ncbi:MAG: 6-pyruvoyl tetrahydropterin synthase family protein [Aestuariibacter sp.]
MQLFVNDLTVMDFSYLCPERGMVGESWIVDVVLNGALNEESMVLDFGKVKKELKYLIDEYVDHKLLIPAEHPFTHIQPDNTSDNVLVHFQRPEKLIWLNCPADAYAFVYDTSVNMASVSQYLKEVIATHLPENVDDIELNLRAEEITTPFYHYSHGLKKHDGNCQRIAHGHRSKISIQLDQQESLKYQSYWADRWQDIYIGSEEDIVTFTELLGPITKKVEENEVLCFSYESTQGRFELLMPRSECEIVGTDSTVECLAQYVADQQKSLTPDNKIRVAAYEGVGKGAIAYA